MGSYAADFKKLAWLVGSEKFDTLEDDKLLFDFPCQSHRYMVLKWCFETMRVPLPFSLQALKLLTFDGSVGLGSTGGLVGLVRELLA